MSISVLINYSINEMGVGGSYMLTCSTNVVHLIVGGCEISDR